MKFREWKSEQFFFIFLIEAFQKFRSSPKFAQNLNIVIDIPTLPGSSLGIISGFFLDLYIGDLRLLSSFWLMYYRLYICKCIVRNRLRKLAESISPVLPAHLAISLITDVFSSATHSPNFSHMSWTAIALKRRGFIKTAWRYILSNILFFKRKVSN